MGNYTSQSLGHFLVRKFTSNKNNKPFMNNLNNLVVGSFPPIKMEDSFTRRSKPKQNKLTRNKGIKALLYSKTTERAYIINKS